MPNLSFNPVQAALKSIEIKAMREEPHNKKGGPEFQIHVSTAI